MSIGDSPVSGTPLPESVTAPSTEAGPVAEMADDSSPLRAVHTPNFPALLRQLGTSFMATTYQAGKLVIVRDEGDHLNTHFRIFQSPMGMALSKDRLAIGTSIQIWDYVNVSYVAYVNNKS